MSKSYAAGKPIASLDEMMAALDETAFVFVSGKLVHRGWAISWHINYARNLIRAGLVQWANRKEEEAKP